jgi:glucose/arabinose dehydrogenase
MQKRPNTQDQPSADVVLQSSRVRLGKRLRCALPAVSALATVPATWGATVWTGPTTNFTNVTASDQDRLTPNVWITRGSAQGIYNAKTEAGFTHFFSPADTEWADGTTANYASLTYTDWNTWAKVVHPGPPSTVGVNAVVHLISEDIYLDVNFTSWGGLGGGFSWDRSTPAPANAPPSVTITTPTNNATLSSSANLTIQATAGDPEGSVTNVQFFDGAASLGNDATSPYSVTVRLEVGVHTLTAVATDNLGAAGTSAPVVVTMARYLPALTNGSIALFLQPVATNLAAPLYAIGPPGDTRRLFVAEQNGLVRIVQDGTLLPGAALDIQSRVSPPLNPANANDERGLLGLAFHPGFNTPASPGYRTLYTYNSEMIPAATTPTYPVPTAATNNYKNVVNEWKISNTDTNVVDPASRREVISFGKTAANHNGDTIAFGPDGYLYLALGDGGNANDVGDSHIESGGNSQNLGTPLGKMLRFNPLHPSLTLGSPDPISANGQYRIPTSNPFQGPGQVPEIYAYGLRNPYRFCFDRANGDLILADVGQNNIEEINRIVLGGNYGGAFKEGDFLFNRTNGPSGAAGTIGTPPGNRSPGVPAGMIDPISGPMGTLEYDHNEGISITGGFVYRGAAMPELYGKYIFGDLALKNQPVRADGRLFYADLQAGTINAFPLPQFGGTAILPNGLTVHGFGEDADGELYALVTNTSANGTGGVVYKLFSVRLTLAVSGHLLDISWPVAGGRLQTQTNSPGAGITPNWVTFPGSTTTNRVLVPIDPANGSVFYRLAVP